MRHELAFAIISDGANALSTVCTNELAVVRS